MAQLWLSCGSPLASESLHSAHYSQLTTGLLLVPQAKGQCAHHKYCERGFKHGGHCRIRPPTADRPDPLISTESNCEGRCVRHEHCQLAFKHRGKSEHILWHSFLGLVRDLFTRVGSCRIRPPTVADVTLSSDQISVTKQESTQCGRHEFCVLRNRHMGSSDYIIIYM